MQVEENSAKSGNEMVALTIKNTNHLADFPAQEKFFSKKMNGNTFIHPKAAIKILSIPYPKNGLANLL